MLTATNDMSHLRLRLDALAAEHERPEFVADDPISLPHRYHRREDIEVAALLAALIAWGNRKAIVRSCQRLGECLGASPYDFVMGHDNRDALRRHLDGFVHRTLNADDLADLLLGLRQTYLTFCPEGTLQGLFRPTPTADLRTQLIRFRARLTLFVPPTAWRHLPDATSSAAKRLCMFLRWMVRPSERGVDFGLWSEIRPSELVIPLDVHVAQSAERLGLAPEKPQADWRTAAHITARLREMCPEDPLKYDFALFAADIERQNDFV